MVEWKPMCRKLSLLGKLALIATVNFSFVVPSSGQQITSTNIHRRILETNKGMSFEEIKGVFSQRYAEICGDDRKITLDEFMQVPEFHKFRGKVLSHPSIEKLSNDEKAKMEHFFRNTQARAFSLFDRNNDQSISETEFVEMSLKTVERGDRNGDQFLSIQEVQEDMERRRKLAESFEAADKRMGESMDEMSKASRILRKSDQEVDQTGKKVNQ